jgi:imidazolonepropionase-like amidohydrolase
VAPTVIPGGLVDAHAHLTFDLEDAGLPAGPGRVAANLAAAAESGVLAVRDAGSRDGIAPELLDPLRHQAAARFVAPAGGPNVDWYDSVAPADLVDEVAAQARAGAPWIKLMADYPGADGNWFAPRVLYDLDLVGRAIAAAHAHGARVMTHVSGPIVADLVNLGVDSIEHGPLIDAPVLEAMARRGTLWCPTLATIERHLRPIHDVVPAVIATFERWALMLPLAVALGVPVLAGSDELGPRGLAWEIEALVRLGGLTPPQALDAATTGARAVLRLPVIDGDEVLFEDDPADDLGALSRIVAVRRADAASTPSSRP